MKLLILDLLEADTQAWPDPQKTGTLVGYDIQQGVEMQYLVLLYKRLKPTEEWSIGVTVWRTSPLWAIRPTQPLRPIRLATTAQWE